MAKLTPMLMRDKIGLPGVGSVVFVQHLLRYLDLEPSRNRTQEAKWILDFNQAYNPWCAYSEAYACPFVPVENWLEVPIYAGEKDYHLLKTG